VNSLTIFAVAVGANGVVRGLTSDLPAPGASSGFLAPWL